MNNHITPYVKYINNQYDETFDQLLREFFLVKLNINLNIIPVDTSALVGFEVLVFGSDNKKQFVSSVTKEVLLEIELIPPKFEIGGKFKQGCIYYEEFWR